MAVLPERQTDAMRPRLQPVTITVGPKLGVRAWYRQAREAGWSRRDSFRGARLHGR